MKMQNAKPLWLTWLPLVLGTVVALVLLQIARTEILTKLDEAAFGRDTQNVLSQVNGEQVSCMYASDSPKCVEGYGKYASLPAILWLGNSQLAAINRYKSGDRTASTLLHEKLRERGYYVVSYSQPNANLFEHGLVFTALEPKFKPRVLILPVFLDKIREQGIRPSVAAFLDDPLSRARATASPLWPFIAPSLSGASSGATTATSDVPFHVKFEAGVSENLSKAFGLWRDRSTLKGMLGVGLFRLRNMVLGINAQTKRKVDSGVYREKMIALEAILKDARDHDVRVLLYIPPYRQDIEGPYVASEYAKLKQDVATLSTKYKLDFVDIDNIVPGPEWATVVDEIFGIEDFDFVHFTEEGHKRHAEALNAVLRRMGY